MNKNILECYFPLLLQTNSEGVKIKELYFIYLAILRKAANNVALLQSTAGTSKKQVVTSHPVIYLVPRLAHLQVRVWVQDYNQ